MELDVEHVIINAEAQVSHVGEIGPMLAKRASGGWRLNQVVPQLGRTGAYHAFADMAQKELVAVTQPTITVGLWFFFEKD